MQAEALRIRSEAQAAAAELDNKVKLAYIASLKEGTLSFPVSFLRR